MTKVMIGVKRFDGKDEHIVVNYSKLDNGKVEWGGEGRG